MSELQSAKFWKVALPCEWATPPEFWSLSSLRDVESCPRRWALRRSSYSLLGAEHSYPSRPSLPVVEGVVVHEALEVLIRALVEAGCTTMHSESAISVMRHLGGISTVITKAIDNALRGYDGNVRAENLKDRLGEVLKSRTPAIRLRIQSVLSQMTFPETTQSKGPRVEKKSGTGTAGLGPGCYTEMRLSHTAKGWAGRADLIKVYDPGVEIVDYKAGFRSPDHEAQLRFYGLLWLNDRKRNPRGRAPTDLTLHYPDGQVRIPAPSLAEYAAIEKECDLRIGEMTGFLSKSPPPARTSPENCIHCDVRHLCSTYWAQIEKDSVFPANFRQKYVDAEVAVANQRALHTWDVVVRTCTGSPRRGIAVILKAAGAQERQRSIIEASEYLRVLDAKVITSDDHTEANVLLLGRSSEVYALESSQQIGLGA